MSENTFVAAEEESDFSGMLDASFSSKASLDRCLVKGLVKAVTNDDVMVEVSTDSGQYVTEGYIPLREFKTTASEIPSVGHQVDVFLEKLDGRDGNVVLSYEQAKKEALWTKLAEVFENNTSIAGKVLSRVRGGFSVDLGGIQAFLPSSHIDVRPVKDTAGFLEETYDFRLLRMDRQRNNIVVSRRAVIEEKRSSERSKLFETLEEGQVIKGRVKNITDYGAFVDLGGIDGLLHVTDMSWTRVSDPRSVVSMDELLNVKVIRFNKETNRISLGLKQLKTHPMAEVIKNYSVGQDIVGTVTGILDYGVFVELEKGVEGLMHVSSMGAQGGTAKLKKFSVGQKVRVSVLEIDTERYRLYLGLSKSSSPQEESSNGQYKVGNIYDVTVTKIVSDGLEIEIGEEKNTGFVHLEDLDWHSMDVALLKKYAIGDSFQAKLLTIKENPEHFIMGVKQTEMAAVSDLSVGSVMTCEVKKIFPHFMTVVFGDKLILGRIDKFDLASDRYDQKTDRFAAGEKTDAKLIKFDGSGLPKLSIKELRVQEEKGLAKKYGSSQSGATLGEILGVKNK